MAQPDLAAPGTVAVHPTGAGELTLDPSPPENSAPGPWMTTNQNTKTAAQTSAVIAKIRPSTPPRWSWPAARRTRIHAWSSRRRSASAPNRNANSPDEGDEDAEADAAREVVDLRADPQAGERDRPPAEQAEDDHRAEQDAGERAVEALAQRAAALGQRAEADRGRAGPAADEQAAVLSGVVAHRLSSHA